MRPFRINGIYKVRLDDEDFERCSFYKWHKDKKQIRGYIEGKRVSLSNFIMNDYTHMYDHKDTNYLNNQKENLRICNYSLNASNSHKKLSNKTSTFRGVYFHPCGKWAAQIRVNFKKRHLGYFDAEIEAAEAYNKAAIKYFGEFACLNSIKS